MSATATVSGPVRYKDQLKLMRASTATSWMIAAFGWLIGAFRTEPATESVREATAPTRYYGAFY